MPTPIDPAFLPEADQFDAQVPQLEDGWWPTGGPVDPATNSGIMNWQPQVPANRSRWLKNRVDPLVASNLQVAGLATGGGPVNASPTISVLVATQAQAEAGVDNATAMTPLRVAQRVAALLANATVQAGSAMLNAISALGANGFIARTGAGAVAARSLQAGTGIAVTNGDGVAGNPTIGVDLATAFGSSLAATGWQRLPSGLIMQWGVVSVPAASSALFTLPIAFPTNFLQGVCMAGSTPAAGATYGIEGVGLTQVRLHNAHATLSQGLRFIVLGV